MKQALLVYHVGMSAGMGHEHFGAAPQHMYPNRGVFACIGSISGPFLVLWRGFTTDRPCSPVALVFDSPTVVLQAL